VQKILFESIHLFKSCKSDDLAVLIIAQFKFACLTVGAPYLGSEIPAAPGVGFAEVFYHKFDDLAPVRALFDVAGGAPDSDAGHIADQQITGAVEDLSAASGYFSGAGIFSLRRGEVVVVVDDLYVKIADSEQYDKRHSEQEYQKFNSGLDRA
jgi:hypothetical protein